MTYNEVKTNKSCKRMKTGWRQCLAVLLAFAMVLSGMPFSANFERGVYVKADTAGGAPASEAVTGSGASVNNARTADGTVYILDAGSLEAATSSTEQTVADYFTVTKEFTIESNKKRFYSRWKYCYCNE